MAATATVVKERQNDVVEMWIRKQHSKRHRKGRNNTNQAMKAQRLPELNPEFYPDRKMQLASWRGTMTKDDFRTIAKRVVPYGIHDEIAYAMELNHQHKGAICELIRGRQPITRMHIYSIVVSYLRHEYTEYNDLEVKGGLVRKKYNDHESAKSIMGERNKW